MNKKVSDNVIENYVLNEQGTPEKKGEYELSLYPFVDFSIIQTVGASLLNRDNNGHQKTMIFGTTPRMRISSQCWKRVIRDHMDSGTVNTRRITYLLREELAHLNISAEDFEKIDAFILKEYLNDKCEEKETSKDDKKNMPRNRKTKRAHYVSSNEIARIADFIEGHLDGILTGEDLTKEVEEAKLTTVLTGGLSVNKSLFGCMATEPYIRTVNGATNFSQSFSVDSLRNGLDYFVAREDVKTGLDTVEWGNDAEAAIPGTMELNSNTLYRHITLNIGLLLQNLAVGKDLSNPDDCEIIKMEAKDVVEKFAKSLVMLTPTAKQHSCETNTSPYMVFTNMMYSDGMCGMKTYESAFTVPSAFTGSDPVEKVAADKLAREVVCDAETQFDTRKYVARYWIEKGVHRSFPECVGIETNVGYLTVIEKMKAMIDEVEFVIVEGK